MSNRPKLKTVEDKSKTLEDKSKTLEDNGRDKKQQRIDIPQEYLANLMVAEREIEVAHARLELAQAKVNTLVSGIKLAIAKEHIEVVDYNMYRDARGLYYFGPSPTPPQPEEVKSDANINT